MPQRITVYSVHTVGETWKRQILKINGQKAAQHAQSHSDLRLCQALSNLNSAISIILLHRVCTPDNCRVFQTRQRLIMQTFLSDLREHPFMTKYIIPHSQTDLCSLWQATWSPFSESSAWFQTYLVSFFSSSFFFKEIEMALMLW